MANQQSFRFLFRTDSITHRTKTAYENSFRELQIPVDFGHLAAKEFGSPTGDKLIAIHGWQDNAGSFDTLIPLLSPNLHIIALDRAGHGLSSHKPLGYPYYYWDYTNHIKIVADFFNWKKFSILGHSAGALFAFLYASIYPEMVSKVISIDDPLLHLIYSPEFMTRLLKQNIDKYLKLEEKLKNNIPPPVYSEADALRLMIESRKDITEESAKILMKRGIKHLENGKVIFSRDIRTKFVWDNGLLCVNIIEAIISNIKCDLLLIKAKQHVFNNEISNNIFKLFQTKCKSFKIVQIDGNHFVHLNNPERIAPIVKSFLLNTE